MLVPRWKVDCLPLSEGSRWQVRITECVVASFYTRDNGCWLPGGPELNFNVGLERNKMPAVTNCYWFKYSPVKRTFETSLSFVGFLLLMDIEASLVSSSELSAA